MMLGSVKLVAPGFESKLPPRSEICCDTLMRKKREPLLLPGYGTEGVKVTVVLKAVRSNTAVKTPAIGISVPAEVSTTTIEICELSPVSGFANCRVFMRSPKTITIGKSRVVGANVGSGEILIKAGAPGTKSTGWVMVMSPVMNVWFNRPEIAATGFALESSRTCTR